MSPRGIRFALAALAGAFLAVAIAAPAPAQTLTIASGQPGGLLDRVALGVVQAVQAGESRYRLSNFPGETGAANAKLLSTGGVDLALVQGAELAAARRGEAPFDAALEGLTAIAALGVAAPVHVLVRAETAARLAEAAGANGSSGAETPVAASRLAALPAPVFGLMPRFGVSAAVGQAIANALAGPGEPKVTHDGLRPQLAALARGEVDAVIAPILLRHRAVGEAAATSGLAALGLSESTVAMLERRFGMAADTLPAGAYAFLDRPVSTASSTLVLAARAETEPEAIAAVTLALYANLDRLRAVHPVLSEIDRRSMAAVDVVPLHPGARQSLEALGLVE